MRHAHCAAQFGFVADASPGRDSHSFLPFHCRELQPAGWVVRLLWHCSDGVLCETESPGGNVFVGGEVKLERVVTGSIYSGCYMRKA